MVWLEEFLALPNGIPLVQSLGSPNEPMTIPPNYWGIVMS